MEERLQDLRYALRGLRKSPGFTLVSVVTLALGIGVNSSIFSLVNAVLLKPLPVERPGELVDIYGHTATSSTHDSNSYPNFLDYRARSRTLSGLIGYTDFFANFSLAQSHELVVGELVTEGYFQLLGVEPELGRVFGSDEFRAPSAAPVAVISHAFWQARFGGAPDILGRTFRMNGIVYDVVGVAPEGFGGMFPAVSVQMWIPATMVEEVEPLGNQRNSGTSTGETRLERRGQHWLWIRGRMKPGVRVEDVRADLEGIAAQLSAEYPETNDLERVEVVRTEDVAINPDFDSTLTPAGMLILGAVGLVLLVACANLANMLLARASARKQELAVRLALGASRGRLVRQMLTETTLLALGGGAVALLLADWLAGLISRLQPPLPLVPEFDISPDWRVLVFTLAAALGTGLVFGMVPALRASKPNLVPALKSGGGGGGDGGKGFALRDVLVVVQVATSVVLLVGGALLVRSLAAAHRVDLGYQADRLAFLSLALDMNGYDADQGAALVQSSRLRLEALPEVEAVGLTSRIPLSLNNNGFGVFIDGYQGSAADTPFRMDGARVDESYFDALGLQLVEGRGIEPGDREPLQRVAVVTRAMAERYWPGQSAVQREFRLSWGGEPYRIVGVVEDHKVDTPGEAPKPYLYLPLNPRSGYVNFIVRTESPAAELVGTLERELHVLDPDLVFLDTGTLAGLAGVRLFPILAGAWFIGVFGALALVLAGVGLYGVIGYAVSRRVRELGLRKALGAERGRIVGLVLRDGMGLVALGGVIGGVLALGAARLLRSALFVGSLDPLSFGLAFGVLAAVGALANLVPAWRAARVDPMLVLRSE